MKHAPRIVYLCGPRTGFPDTNIPLFSTASDALRSTGLQVINPVDVNLSFLGTTYSPPRMPNQEQTLPGLRADIIALTTICDSIALLPAWEHAVGCRVEVGIGITFGYHFLDWQTGKIISRPPSITIEHGYFDRPPLPSNAPPGKAVFGERNMGSFEH